ncbi:VCBS repeat-containing protein [Lewinella sp. JB7]|uniref:VCBS repeat-containing protein n=1 Tax=Lewinella sp. JB7 TaxID=2962887 RepID=UPI0020C9EDDE|nr:VCBS repeat-containing protein [Lewinella sp. JB7]MCP9237653.1 VCBS repeat-containing protein [Lewinella sp. JB7]
MTAPGVNITGIDFRNDLVYTDELNPYTYRNFYNGGGVGIGDFDNDGLPDIYFTGNLVDNRLYRNLGDFRFADVTDEAGVACSGSWSTGVAVADVNADGFPDLYVCKAGPPAGESIAGMAGVRYNELFINQGDGTFVESARSYGLDVTGLSVHAAFFDYDDDGDLDCYLLNNSTRATTGYDLEEGLRDVPDPEGGNKLFRNLLSETGQTRFEDVTSAAGIYSSRIGFGLGVTVGDVDLDGLPDLFVSNDYFERDYLYYNNGDGTFREELVDHLPEISKGSMGADLADLNNDGLPELFVTEMLPPDERRYKTKAAFEGWNRYQLYRDRGYHQQFSRNVLQLNLGNGHFSEIGRLAGVEATDWSWGALLCDLDNDGNRDIFVANGTGKDLLDQDYINFNGSPAAVRRMIFGEGKGITELIDQIPSEALQNAVFRNNGNLTFTDVAAEWGLDQLTFSNGSAYADLDNDGDLDLVVNNVYDRAGVYRNNTTVPSRMVRLRSDQAGNPNAIGAEVTAKGEGVLTYTQLYPMRGFQSTVDTRIHIPFRVDSITVRWPDGLREIFPVARDSSRILELRRGSGRRAGSAPEDYLSDPPERIQTAEVADQHGIVTTREDPATDFDRDPLLFLGINNEGPALATADVNGDGRPDLFLGGAAGQPGRLLIANSDGTYRSVSEAVFAEDAVAENVDAVFFDADGDGDPDLYIANGSNQFGAASAALFDHLYQNEGGDRWVKMPWILPSSKRPVASSCVRAHDFDGDGDTDLFVGGRLRPGTYGVPTDSYLLQNRGAEGFHAITVPTLGMVTDAAWIDVDGDGNSELAVAAEWGTLRYLHFDQKGQVTRTDTIPGTTGLWHALAVADFDGDGTPDLAAGNHGLNSRLRASADRPLRMYINDFDGNGKAEQIVTRYAEDGRSYPLVLRDDLVKQLPGLRKSVPGYHDYQGKTMGELFPREILSRSVVYEVTELRSLIVLNEARAPRIVFLPDEAQLAPLYALQAFGPAGQPSDLLAGGNQSVGRPELGIYAGDFGLVLRNRGDGHFMAEDPRGTGMYLRGDLRGIVDLGTDGNSARSFIIARSQGPVLKLKVETE